MRDYFRVRAILRFGPYLPLSLSDIRKRDASYRDSRVICVDRNWATALRSALSETGFEIARSTISRYARAVADVGPLTSLLTELRQRETRRDHLRAQLRAVAGAASVAALDPSHVRRDLRERLTDWQGLLGRETPEARQILREVLVGRLIFRPKIDGSVRYYEFTGQATLSGLLAGVVASDKSKLRARAALPTVPSMSPEDEALAAELVEDFLPLVAVGSLAQWAYTFLCCSK